LNPEHERHVGPEPILDVFISSKTPTINITNLHNFHQVVVCEDRFKDIVPGCEIDARVEMFTAEAAESLLEGNPDYVLDAIDDINTKADLLLACHARNLRVMSALGAGAKADPTRILIGTITDPVKDPLAGKLRWTMRKRLFAEGDSAASTWWAKRRRWGGGLAVTRLLLF
jgi:tRNA A37 threonylcarbamoyladenosine dehydratase